MPYNTRRKSLSLPSLGIHVPGHHPARGVPQAASGRASSRPLDLSPSTPPPSKRPRRSPDGQIGFEPASTLTATSKYSEYRRQRTGTMAVTPEQKVSKNGHIQEAPHPNVTEKDEESTLINDEIVEAVIARLRQVNNRPLLVKELATVLSQDLAVVQQSANPCAIISSRLSAFLRRSSWTSATPCPLVKELESVHPRRTYFFLAGEHPLRNPKATVEKPPRRPTTPSSPISLSSQSFDNEEEHRCRVLSPSPEIDLSPPEFDDGDDDVAMPTTPVHSVSPRSMFARSHRSASPPLEKDEREFTQTADGLQRRKRHNSALDTTVSDHVLQPDDIVRDEAIFEEPKLVAVSMVSSMTFITSPPTRPFTVTGVKKETEMDSWSRLEKLLEWDHSPEHMELEELDGLLDSC